MTSFQSRRVDPNSSDEGNSDAHGRESGTASEPPDRLELTTWSELIANGEIGFPAGLTTSEQEALLRAVQVRRRRRLVQFIARVIAQDILQSRRQVQGGN